MNEWMNEGCFSLHLNRCLITHFIHIIILCTHSTKWILHFPSIFFIFPATPSAFPFPIVLPVDVGGILCILIFTCFEWKAKERVRVTNVCRVMTVFKLF